MRKIITLFAILLFGAAAVAAESPVSTSELKSLDELAAMITSFFPNVQGEVTAVDGDRLTISLGSKDGIRAGMMLSLWREGREIRHPVTGAVIGRAEDNVGEMDITGVDSATSTGVLMRRLKDPKQGDRARITPKKISLALIPDRVEKPSIMQDLAAKLTDYGRFTVLDREKTTAFLRERKDRSGSLIKDLGRTFNLDVVAVVSVYPSEDRYLVTTKLFYADEARPLDTIIALIDLRTKKDAFGDVKPFFAPVPEEKTGIAELPFDAQLFAADDLEGNGSLQYVFSDGARIHVFKHGQSGWHEVWAEKKSHNERETQHINLDVADINGNGKPEIFVTTMVSGKVTSYVLESQGERYSRIAELPGFLRVVSYPGRGTVLIGQAYDPVTFYGGEPKLYAWSGDHYAAGPAFPLPHGVGLYGFAFTNTEEGRPLLVAFGEEGTLLAYTEGTLIWKSEDYYPFIGITVKKPVTGIDAVLDEEEARKDKNLKVMIPGRIIARDLNGDGRDEIIVPKNIGATFLKGPKEAELYRMAWTGSRLDPRWNTKVADGIVLDFHVLQDGEGAQIVALVKSPGGVFSSDTFEVKLFPMK